MTLTFDIATIITAIMAALAAFMLIALLVLIAVYVYTSWALMTIANKTKTKYAWLAWIPIANLYLIVTVAKLRWQYLFLMLLVLIPGIGGMLCMGLMAWWYWRIAEVRKLPGWLGILMIIPVINLIVLGILAWGK
jgi:hypothetical protein